MLKIRKTVSTGAAALVAMSAMTGLNATVAQAEEAGAAQPGTEADSTETAEETTDSQPGTETTQVSDQAQLGTDSTTAASNSEANNADVNAGAQPGTTAPQSPNANEAATAQPGTETAETPDVSNAPSDNGTDNSANTPAQEGTGDNATTGVADNSDNYVPAPQPVESANDAEPVQSEPQYTDEIVNDAPVSEEPSEQPVENTTPQLTYDFATYEPEDAAPVDTADDVEGQPAAETTDTAAADVTPAPAEQAPASQPVESANPQPAPAAAPAPAPEPAAPANPNEVTGASMSIQAGNWEVTAQGTAQPFDGTVTVSDGVTDNTFAMPAKEVAAAQKAGQDFARSLPQPQQDALNNAHNAVIDQVEHLPQDQSAQLGGASAHVTVDHAGQN